ncbi:MAG TPA: protein translocase subunit SecD [Cyanobacteria bacterium UBA8530]|nr:protein translocase subunit SecD [Cyanobacteria bacterium UBA8530]
MTPRKIILMVVTILVLGALFILQDRTHFPTKLGLDIQGGMQLVLEAKDTKDIKVTKEVMKSVIAVVRNRVDAFGVSEPLIQRKGDRQVIVELPGIKDPERARRLIGKTAQLEFVEQIQGMDKKSTEWKSTGLTGRMLSDAKAEPNSGAGGGWAVAITFDSQGAKLFGDITSRLVGKPLGITLDGKIISSPNVNEPILQGNASISGSFTAQQAQDLAIQLKAGSLPVPLDEIENRTVGPTLGQDTVNHSIRAGIVGFILVALFMVFIYRLPGMVADIALAIYAVFVLAIFHLIPVTLTVPGIAGFILSIGMAVDANVLIFERTKEELKRGRTLYSAIEIGFKRAFTSIFDSNMNTLLTCAVLYYFGTGLVRGFALTLAIGVIVSLFTAISVTRALLHQILEAKNLKKASFFGVNVAPVEQKN